MEQTLINFIIAGIGAAVAFILKVIWEGLRELQQADLHITARLNEVQLLVAGQYVRKDELKDMVTALFAKLDKIEAKVDRKVDKPNPSTGGQL